MKKNSSLGQAIYLLAFPAVFIVVFIATLIFTENYFTAIFASGAVILVHLILRDDMNKRKSRGDMLLQATLISITVMAIWLSMLSEFPNPFGKTGFLISTSVLVIAETAMVLTMWKDRGKNIKKLVNDTGVWAIVLVISVALIMVNFIYLHFGSEDIWFVLAIGMFLFFFIASADNPNWDKEFRIIPIFITIMAIGAISTFFQFSEEIIRAIASAMTYEIDTDLPVWRATLALVGVFTVLRVIVYAFQYFKKRVTNRKQEKEIMEKTLRAKEDKEKIEEERKEKARKNKEEAEKLLQEMQTSKEQLIWEKAMKCEEIGVKIPLDLILKIPFKDAFNASTKIGKIYFDPNIINFAIMKMIQAVNTCDDSVIAKVEEQFSCLKEIRTYTGYQSLQRIFLNHIHGQSKEIREFFLKHLFTKPHN